MLATNQYEAETTLINFRVPKTLKKTFDSVCKYKTENRTKTLIDLMKTFKESQETGQETSQETGQAKTTIRKEGV